MAGLSVVDWCILSFLMVCRCSGLQTPFNISESNHRHHGNDNLISEMLHKNHLRNDVAKSGFSASRNYSRMSKTSKFKRNDFNTEQRNDFANDKMENGRKLVNIFEKFDYKHNSESPCKIGSKTNKLKTIKHITNLQSICLKCILHEFRRHFSQSLKDGCHIDASEAYQCANYCRSYNINNNLFLGHATKQLEKNYQMFMAENANPHCREMLEVLKHRLSKRYLLLQKKRGKRSGSYFSTSVKKDDSKVTIFSAEELRVKPVPRLHEMKHFSPAILKRARKILEEAPLIDGHNDLPWSIQNLLRNKLNQFNLSADLRKISPFKDSVFSHTDIPRMKEGFVGGQIWSIHTPCASQFRNAVQLLVEQVDSVRRMILTSPDTKLVKTPYELWSARSTGRIASMISVGGGHGLGNSLGVLRSLNELGVSSVALTHACHTPWAESDLETGGTANHRGLTEFGKNMVKEMNRLGIIVDLSHASTATVRDAIATSRAPMIVSHTAARAICALSRNVPDTILKTMAKSGGVVMVTFDSDYLACGKNATLFTVIEHLQHIRRVAGVDHIGIGSAFDGFERPALGLEDTSRYPNLFAALLETQPSWSREELLKVAGRNFMRVFKKVKEVRDSLSSEPPNDAIIPYKDIDKSWPCRYKFTKPYFLN